MKLFDNQFRSSKIKLLAGVDEAGRGPLAGPVVAAAVIFKPDDFILGVNDSKKLSEKSREEFFYSISNRALAFSYKIISPKIIDEINILQASLFAMKSSVEQLKVNPDLILIDGNKKFESSIPSVAIVKGDAKSFSIAAASIIAKVIRDDIMKKLSDDFPEYNWFKNKGYPTKEHISAVKKYGATVHHRKSFLKNILGQHQIEIF